MSLVDLATLKEYLPELGSSASQDSKLQNLLDRVEIAVANYLGFPKPSNSAAAVSLSSTTYIFYFDGSDVQNPELLQLPVKPIVSLTSAYSDPDRAYDSSHQIANGDIEIDSAKGQLIILPTSTKAWERAFRAIKITCVAGYQTAPPDMEHAICVWCSQLHRMKENQGLDLIVQEGANIKISPRTMPKEVKEILRSFRNPRSIL